MKLTRHAKKRWEERFPDLDVENEFAKVRRVGRAVKKKIKKSCPKNTEYCGRAFRGRYLMMTREKIVFVMAPGNIVITVLDFRSA